MLSEKSKAKKRYQSRKRRISYKVNETCKINGRLCLSIFRSCKHLYVQLKDVSTQKTIVSASTLNIAKELNNKTYNKIAATQLGVYFATKVKSVLNVDQVLVAFDRAGKKFGPVLDSFAQAAKESGIILN